MQFKAVVKEALPARCNNNNNKRNIRKNNNNKIT